MYHVPKCLSHGLWSAMWLEDIKKKSKTRGRSMLLGESYGAKEERPKSSQRNRLLKKKKEKKKNRWKES